MCKTHKIAKQLDVKILKHLKGAQILDVPEHGALEDGFYLVEKDDNKMILQTSWLGDLGDVPESLGEIIESQDEGYVLYEYKDQ